MSRNKKDLMEQLSRLSPRTVEYLIGMSLALDPAPCRRYGTFLSSDAEALLSDWIAVSSDFNKAVRDNVQKHPSLDATRIDRDKQRAAA